MQKNESVLLIGGDARSRAMAQRLAALGFDMIGYATGTVEGVKDVTSLFTVEEALRQACAVVLPMPAFDGRLHIPRTEADVALPDAPALFARIGGSMPVFGGRVSAAVFALAADHGVCITDYSVSDEVQIRNAIPTAEGAIALAMQALDITLHGAHVAILGFGRIGFALMTRLRALGARVTVGARKPRDIARIECEGCRALRLGTEETQERLLQGGYDVIFNTVPHHLIDNEHIARMPETTVLIELASSPGGWDASAQGRCRMLSAPGLPGVCAPRTAGVILADALAPMLEEVMRA